MRTREIQQWLRGANVPDAESPYDSDDDMAPHHQDTSADDGPPDSLADWDTFLARTVALLQSSRSKVRNAFLTDGVPAVATDADVSSAQRAELLLELIRVYAAHADRASRLALLRAGDALLRAEADASQVPLIDTELVARAADALRAEAAHLASSQGELRASRATGGELHAWACMLLHRVLQTDAEEQLRASAHWKPLAHTFARIHDLLLSAAPARPDNLQRSALKAAWRAVRSAHERIPLLISTLEELAAAPPAPAPALTTLGMVLDVALHLRVGREQAKGAADGVGRTYVREAKPRVLALYATHVAGAKTRVPERVLRAFDGFFAAEVSAGDLEDKVLPALSKTMLRSPEIAFGVAEALLRGAAAPDVAEAVARAAQGALYSAVVSTNAGTRRAALSFVQHAPEAARPALLDATLKAAKPGEARSEEQREAIYTLLGSLLQNARAAEVLAAYVQKETHPEPLQHAVGHLVHYVHGLPAGSELPAAVAPALLSKLQSPKAPLRCDVLDRVVLPAASAPAAGAPYMALFEQLVPAMETCLKNAASSALTSGDAAIEACLAVRALCALPFSALGEKTAGALRKNTLLQGALQAKPKPSFLLNERVARRMREAPAARAAVLAGALCNVVARFGTAALHDAEVQPLLLAQLREQLRTPGADRVVRAFVEQLSALDAPLAATVAAQLVRGHAGEVAEDAKGLRAMLTAPMVPGAQALDLLAPLVVPAHMAELDDAEHGLLVHMCRTAQLEPGEAVSARAEAILGEIDAAERDPALADAAGAALANVAFIAPAAVVPRVCARAEADLALDDLQRLSEQDLAIWATPPDVLCVDVLQKSQAAPSTKKGSSSMEQWEAEVRASIAAKKEQQGGKTLSKQEQQAVDAQFAKEREVRAHVEAVRTRVHTALRRVRCVFAARVEALDAYVWALTSRVYACAAEPLLLDRLGGGDAVRAALEALAGQCGARAADVQMGVCFALLRFAGAETLVPLDHLLESLDEQVTRLLYRLRFTVEQGALDVASTAFLAPFIREVVQRSTLRGQDEADDLVVEKVQLALEYIAGNSSVASDVRFPRAETLTTLLAVVRRFPMLAKDAVGALREYGDALAADDEVPAALLELLLAEALAEERLVRQGALECLAALDLTEAPFLPALWLAVHDADAENARLAARVWEENALEVPAAYAEALVPLLAHPHAYVRDAAPRAIAAASAAHPAQFGALRSALVAQYEAKLVSLEPEYDAYGMVIEATLHRTDPWEARVAVAETLRLVAAQFAAEDVVPLLSWMLRPGAALGERVEAVRHAMLEAARAVVEAAGGQVLDEVVTLLEGVLGGDKGAESDALTEAGVILLGRAAAHLAPGDQRTRRVVDRLLAALHTPSELVQEAVAACLPELVRSDALAADLPKVADQLFAELLHGESYAVRRGAAYGLAGVVQGRGINSLRDLRVLPRLSDAVAQSSAPTERQGALFAYETLTRTLRVLFEPYVRGILGDLLVCFGDTHAEVREATEDAARALMQHISGQCLKQVLPQLLEGLEEKQWRTKKGAIELLGAMAYCAPRQLSAALPTVIPRLSEVLADSHTQVRTAANKSLKQFGKVIHNPEVNALVPVLLKALVDPNAKTAAALRALLETKFVHYIDAPSLALIAPILERGLRERVVGSQKNAAQIVGSLASLTDARDFVPYLPRYTPLVRAVLVSPVPDARSVAAKALGTLVERLGEVHFLDLVPSLLRVLQTDATGVDRHGAAQGLAEVLAGLGMERMEQLLPSIIEHTHARAAYVREGHLALLIYLPATFGARFVPHLGRIVPPIVASIADEEESVREASLRAGRMIIVNYPPKAVELLLPQLEPQLFDDSWRNRLSSLQLVGDLLFRLAGISGKTEVEEDESEESAVASNSLQRALLSALGAPRRNQLLASVYILRQDPNMPVRQRAAHIWKALVHNTPRTAREILPVMLDQLVAALASVGDEQREMAGRTLGELVRKLGEKILHEAIPLLADRGANASAAETRAGVCLAVTHVLANATKTQLEDHETAILDMVRHALVDSAPEVRRAAARAFDAVQSHLGERAIDATIPTLLHALHDPHGGATAQAALREVVRARAEVVYPVVVPPLCAQPVSVRHAETLTSLAPVAGPALASCVATVLGALAKTMMGAPAEPTPDGEPTPASAAATAASATLAAVADIEALHQTMVLLLGWMSSSEGPARRAVACDLYVRFCHERNAAISADEYTVDFLRKLVALFAEQDEALLAAAWAALEACVQSVPKEHWAEQLVVPLRRALESTGAADETLPGLCRPRGAQPFVPVLLHGLMHGSAEQREQGALGLSDVVEKTSAEAVRPFVTGMVGPLIRLCGDRHTPPVKTAILASLETMLRRIPALVRPFYPQLQRSFQKAVTDPSSSTVRQRAGAALGALMQHQPRVEPVVLELVQGVTGALDGESLVPSVAGVAGAASGASAVDVGDALAAALAQVVAHAPTDKLSAAARDAVVGVLEHAFHAEEEPRENMKRALADVVAALVRHERAAEGVLQHNVLLPAPVDVQLAALTVRACLEQSPAEFYALVDEPKRVAELVTAWLGEAPSVARPAREARDLLRHEEPWVYDEGVQAA